MNWRRGVLLAGINLLVAVPLILSTEARDAAYLRREMSQLPMLAGICAWFWWFGLLVWQTARAAWRWTARHLTTKPA
jgi:hypothetical protein